MADETNKEPEEVIADLINSPKQVVTDGGTAQAVSVQDVVEADKHLARKAAVTARPKNMGIRIGVLRGPGQF